MPEQERERRISNEEIQVIQKAFKGNQKALKLLRKVFYQLELSEGEEKILRLAFAGGEDLLSVARKIFLPQLSPDDPIAGGASAWIDRKYSDMLSVEARPTILARQDCLKALALGLERLEEFVRGGAGKPRTLLIDVHMERSYEDAEAHEVKRAAIAMQDFTTFVEMQGILQLKSLSEDKAETPEEKAARQRKDSTK